MYIVHNRHNVYIHCVYWTCPLYTMDVYWSHFIGTNGHNFYTLFGNYCEIGIRAQWTQWAQYTQWTYNEDIVRILNIEFEHNGHNRHNEYLLDVYCMYNGHDYYVYCVQWTHLHCTKFPSLMTLFPNFC